MTHRDRAMAVLHYERYDRMPLVHFGFWGETLAKWADEGHVTREEAETWGDGNTADAIISRKLGFDFNWCNCFGPNTGMDPAFDIEVVAEFEDGRRHVRNPNGVIELSIPGVVSIPTEIDHLLKDRESWIEHYRHRYRWTSARVTQAMVRIDEERTLPYAEGGLDWLRGGQREYPYGLFCGSMLGHIRDLMGMPACCMFSMTDPGFLDEIIQTVSDVAYENVLLTLESGARFDFAHFWEDICFKNGPLVRPEFFREHVGPHYRRITGLLRSHGVDIVSVDCDGKIDALVGVWLENGVNTMFPIEVGTWDASIAPWRERYGRALRGVGGMNKTVFARDRAAVDAEVERLRPLVDLGGFIPCPDHRIAPDAQWDLVRYYCERMRKVFG